MHRIHAKNESRYLIVGLECPSCGNKFKHASELQSHMESHDITIEMPRLNSDDSSWKYVVCPERDGKFENEWDMK